MRLSENSLGIMDRKNLPHPPLAEGNKRSENREKGGCNFNKYSNLRGMK